MSAGWLGETGGTGQGNQLDSEVGCMDVEDGWSCCLVKITGTISVCVPGKSEKKLHWKKSNPKY